MSTRTINPYTEQTLREYKVETLEEVRSKIAALGKAQQERKHDLNTRLDALFDEEIFGPVAVLKKFKTYEDAIRIANETPFGLGASIWGEPEEAEKLVPNIEAGMVFVNKIVVSDLRLPFGGVKRSGIGYELSSYGMLEFTHKRTVWVN